MDIVDEFVVTLGLDPSNYKRESQQFREDFRRLKEDTRREGREIEAANRRVAESFSRVKNEIIGLALTIAGARSIGGLVTDMIHGAAETGRFAQTVDMATESVSVWEMAVQSMGGSAQDARSALAALNAEYTSYMLTGRAVHDADLAAMGISARDLQSPEQLALALAERRNSMTQREFTARLERMGLPPSFIRTLSQGRRGVEELLAQMERVGPVTERDARAAIEFERQWSILTNRLRNELRPVLTWLVDHALPWIADHGPEVARVLGVGIGGAVVLMTMALIRAAGPLGIIIAGLTAIIAMWPTIQRSFGNLGTNVGILLNWQRWQSINQRIGHMEESGVSGSDPEYLALVNRRAAIERDLRQGVRRHDGRPEYTDEEYQQNFGPRVTVDVPYGRSEFSSAPGGRGATRRPPPPAPSASASGGRGGGGASYTRVRNALLAQGLPPHIATAVAAHIMAESGGGVGAHNAAGGGQGATGIFQWRGARRRNFERIIGRPLPGASFDDQIRFLMWELRGGDPGGPAVMRARTVEEALSATITRFGRPAPGMETNRDFRVARQYIYGRGGAQTAMRSGAGRGAGDVHVGSITVYVPPGTPQRQAERVADEIPRAVQRRGVVAQANSGLK